MGSPDFAVPSLRATADVCALTLVISQPDRPAGRGRRMKAPAVKVEAERLEIPVLQPEKVRDGTLVAALKAERPDIVVVTAYGRILPEEVLRVPVYGCINVHGSILPRWRGAAPIQRAVLAGDAETGVAIMQMDIGCDTGPVFCVEKTPIGEHETTGALFERLAELGGLALERFLRQFPAVPDARAQPSEGVVHAAKLAKSEGELNWAQPAEAVVNHIRGMDPWPGAFTTRGDQRIKLFGARLAPESIRRGDVEPGTVLCGQGAGLYVACSEGCLEIMELQSSGKRRMAVESYLSGHPFCPGERLGDA